MPDILDNLRKRMHAAYGYENGYPRINLGPCGSFAKIFYEEWNCRFDDKVCICFVMTPGEAEEQMFCTHCIIRLPDGRYFDGGSGVFTEVEFLSSCPELKIEKMEKYNEALLEQRAYGLNREYARCHNYNRRFVRAIIKRHLNGLSILNLIYAIVA